MDWYRALVAPPASASSPRPDLTGTRRDTASTAATPSSRWDSVHAAASAGSRWDSEASVYERGHRRWDPEASVAERGHRRVPSLSDLPSSASSGGPTTPDRHVSTRPRVGSGSVPPSPSTSPGPALVPRAQKGGSLKGAGRQYSGKGYRSALLGPLHNAAYLAALLLLASAMALSWHALFYKSLLAQMQQQQPFMSSSLATADLLYPDEGAAAASLQGREAQEQGPGSEWGAVEGSGQGIAGNSSLHTRLEAALEVCKRKLLPCSPVLLRCAGKQRRQRLLSNLLPWGVTARSLLQGAAKEAEGAGALKSEACKGQGLRDCKALLRSCRDVSKALKSFLLAAPRRQAQGKALRGSVAASGQGAGHLEAEEGATAALASGGLVGASATVLSINCTYFNRNWDKTCLCPGLAGPESANGSMGTCPRWRRQLGGVPGVAEAAEANSAEEKAQAEAGPGVYLGEVLLVRSLLSRATRLRQKGKPASEDASLKGPGGDLVSMLLQRSRTRDPLKAAGVMAVRDILRDRVYQRCAVVGDSALMLAIPRGDEIDAHQAVFRFGGTSPTLTWQRYVGSKTTVRVVRPQDQRHVRELPREHVIVMGETSEDMRAYINFRQFNISRKGLRHYMLSPAFMVYAREAAKAALRIRSQERPAAALRPLEGATPGVLLGSLESQGSQETESTATVTAAADNPAEDALRGELGSQGSPEGTQGNSTEGTHEDSQSTSIDSTSEETQGTPRDGAPGEAASGAEQAQGQGDGHGSVEAKVAAEGALTHQRWSNEGSAEGSADRELGSREGESTGGRGPSVPTVSSSSEAAQVSQGIADPVVESGGAAKRESGAGFERGEVSGTESRGGEESSKPKASGPESASSDGRFVLEDESAPGSQPQEGHSDRKIASETEDQAGAEAGGGSGPTVVSAVRQTTSQEEAGTQTSSEGEPGGSMSLDPAEEGHPESASEQGGVRVSLVRAEEEGLPERDSVRGAGAVVPEFHPEQDPFLQDSGDTVQLEEGAASQALDTQTEAGAGAGVGSGEALHPGTEDGAELHLDDQGEEEEGGGEEVGAGAGEDTAEAVAQERELAVGTPLGERVAPEDQGEAQGESNAALSLATGGAGLLPQGPGRGGPGQGRPAAAVSFSLSAQSAMEVEPELVRAPVIQPGTGALSAEAQGRAKRRLLGLLKAARASRRRARRLQKLQLLRMGSLEASDLMARSEKRGISRGRTVLGLGRQGSRRSLLWVDEEEEQGAERQRLQAKRRKAKARKKAKAKGSKKKLPSRLAAHIEAESDADGASNSRESSALESRVPSTRVSEDGVALLRQQRLKKKKRKTVESKRRHTQPDPVHERDGAVTPPVHQSLDSQGETGASGDNVSASASATGSATDAASGTEAREEGQDGDEESTDSSGLSESRGTGAATAVLGEGLRASSAQGLSATAQSTSAQVSSPLRTGQSPPAMPSQDSGAGDEASDHAGQARVDDAGLAESGSQGRSQASGTQQAGVPVAGQDQEAGSTEVEGGRGEEEGGSEEAQREGEAGEVGLEEVGGEEEGVTEGWVALLLALNTCKEVSVYGWPSKGSLKLGSSKEPKMELPEKYSSRCPQGRLARRATEANDRKRLKKLAGADLVRPGMPCMMECFSPSKACNACITKELSISLLLEGLSQWRQLPTPSYCTTQLQAKAQLPAWMETGLPGDA